MIKFLQTLALALIIFVLCLPENPAQLHGLRRSRVRNRKISIYPLYLCFISSTRDQVPTDSSLSSYHICAMSPENPARLHGLRRSRARNRKIHIYPLYICLISNSSDQVPTDCSLSCYYICAMSSENPARLHGLCRSRVGNK